VAPSGKQPPNDGNQDMDDAAWRDRRFTEPSAPERTLAERLQAQQEAQQRVLEVEGVPEVPKVAKKRADGRPRGNASTAEVVEKRMAVVEEMLREASPIPAIVAKLKPVPFRTVYRYVAVVRERWRRERAAREGTVVEERLSHMRNLAKRLERKEAWSPMVRVEREINLMLGVYAADKVDVRAAVLHAIAPDVQPLDVAAMPEKARRAMLECLDAMDVAEAQPALETHST
jgi:hypothetical protein